MPVRGRVDVDGDGRIRVRNGVELLRNERLRKQSEDDNETEDGPRGVKSTQSRRNAVREWQIAQVTFSAARTSRAPHHSPGVAHDGTEA